MAKKEDKEEKAAKTAKSEPKSEKAKEAAKRKRKIVAKATKAEKLAQEVREALEEAGYELLTFPSTDYRQEFIQRRGYDPRAVLMHTLQVAEMDPDWKGKIVPPPSKEAEKA